MNQIISNQRSRAGRMKNFFTAKNSFITAFADIIAAINGFYTWLTQFDEYAERQQQPITGYAQDKKDAQDKAAEIVTRWGMRCRLKAQEVGSQTLFVLLDHSYADIIGMEDTEGFNLMKDIRTGLNENLTLFTEQGLTAAIITEINEAIDEFATLIDRPKEAISERKMETEALTVYMKQINVRLKNIVSLLEQAWVDDHEDLIMEMKNNYRIDDLGHRFSGIEGSVVLSLPGVSSLGNYKIEMDKQVAPGEDEYKKEALSNLLGEYKIQSLKPGLYNATLKSPAGAVIKTEVVAIKRGVTLDLNWTV